MPEPRCPKCHAVVEPSWDWCMGCGYDPTGARPADGLAQGATRDGVGTWQAPLPPGTTRTTVPATRVTTLVGPDAARPQEMRDPDWVETPPRKLPIPALVGLLAVVAAAIGALGAGHPHRAAPPHRHHRRGQPAGPPGGDHWFTRGPNWSKGHASGTGTGVWGAGRIR